MEAVAKLNAALKTAQVGGLANIEQLAQVAYFAASIPCVLMETLGGRNYRLKLPDATVKALVGGAALSLESGAATVADLHQAARASADERRMRNAANAADNHIRTVAVCAKMARLDSGATGGPQGAVAALLTPRALVSLLEAAAPPLLWAEQFCQQTPESAIDNLSWLHTVVRALYQDGNARDHIKSAGALALASRPAVQRSLAQLVAGRVHRLAPMRHMQSDVFYLSAVINGLQLMGLLGRAGDSAAPWAGWIALHAAAAVVEIGVQRPAGVDGVQHKQMLFKAADAALMCAGGHFMFAGTRGPGCTLRLPRQLTDALARVAAALMVVADTVLPEPRFKGAERVLEGIFYTPVPSPWVEGPPAAATEDFAAPAEVCAALEMAARLLAALPEVFERLPSELQDVSPGSASGHLAHQLWTTVHYGCQRIMFLQQTGDPAEGAAAAVDLLASVAKLQGAASRRWPFPGAADKPKASLLMMSGASCLLGHWFHALPPTEDPGGDGPAPMFVAALIIAVQGMRNVLALPSIGQDNESRLLHVVGGLLCHDLCSEAAFVPVVSALGGFALLEAQVARVFDPVSAFACKLLAQPCSCGTASRCYPNF
jgi:hypothetical protein